MMTNNETTEAIRERVRALTGKLNFPDFAPTIYILTPSLIAAIDAEKNRRTGAVRAHANPRPAVPPYPYTPRGRGRGRGGYYGHTPIYRNMTLHVQNTTPPSLSDTEPIETDQQTNEAWILKRDRGQHSLINKAVFDKLANSPGQSRLSDKPSHIQDLSRSGKFGPATAIHSTRTSSTISKQVISYLGTASPHRTNTRPTHYAAQPPSVLRTIDVREPSNSHFRPKTELCRNFCQTGILCHMMTASPSCCL